MSVSRGLKSQVWST